MSEYLSLSKDELVARKKTLIEEISVIRKKQLSLDMSRGKPSPAQLDLSVDLLTTVNAESVITKEGVDTRNYGGLDGLTEAKQLFSAYLGVSAKEVIVGGNSSLNLMHNAMSTAMLHGTTNGLPWIKQAGLKFICPIPGYDRHFAICEHLGIEMITVDMTDSGPDMDQVERLVEADASIKGIWCVPKYSNPTGTCYSDETVDRLASMNAAAPDFRIFWDNAYAVHHLGAGIDHVKDILESCKQSNHPERVYLFGSTSKLTFPGAGVAMIAGSEKNMDYFRLHLAFQTIGYDKINQLRHVAFFGDMEGLLAHAQRHAVLIGARFDTIQEILTKRLAGKGIADWGEPKGGYFISLDVLPGCASEVITMAGELGVKLTPAGSAFPYKQDREDRNIRIAPSFPSIEALAEAGEVLCVCIELVAIDQRLNQI